MFLGNPYHVAKSATRVGQPREGPAGASPGTTRIVEGMVNIQDWRMAWRQALRNPGFALAVILTLALGIGVNTAVFSLVDGFLLRTLPYPEPERLGVLLLHTEEGGGVAPDEHEHLDGESWDLVRDNVPAVQAASFGQGGGNGVNLETESGGARAIRSVKAKRVSAHYFEVLGQRMLLGREFSEEEDRRGGPAVAILSYGLWHSVFHGDREAIGKVVHVKGAPYVVVGVLPANAQTLQSADVWTSLQPGPNGEGGGTNYKIIMRLKPGATWQEANAQLGRVRKRFFDELETKYKGHAWFYALPMQTFASRETRSPALLLMLAVSFILLIACANLAGLTLVRITRRTSEIATRLALGASRWTLLRELWMESLFLALLGAGVGLGLAVAMVKFLSGFLPGEYLPLGGLGVDLRVLAFAFAASLFASLLFGALPAWQARNVDLRSAMAVNSHSVAHGTSRLRQILIAGEVALTVVLLAGAGLLIRSLVYLETMPPGFDATNVIAAKASLDDARYHDPVAFRQLLERSVTAMRQIPGVEDAAVGLSVPYETGMNDAIKIPEGVLAGKTQASSLAYVTPGYFETLRIPILLGRGITASDSPASQPVAVVNLAFAKKFFSEPNPIGRQFLEGAKTLTIVGVVGNVAKPAGILDEGPMGHEPVFYIPATQVEQGLAMVHVWFQPSWIVRTSKPLEGITGAMQKALAQADPNLPFSGFYSMNDILAENLKTQRAQVLLLGVLAGLALLLSTVGIYGLVSNLVAQRTREIGIRLALGAQMQRVMAEIGRSGVIASATGLVAGMVLALFAVRVLQSQLYGVRVYDPVTLAAVPVVLLVVAMAASVVPALRIARIDPAETLRAE